MGTMKIAAFLLFFGLFCLLAQAKTRAAITDEQVLLPVIIKAFVEPPSVAQINNADQDNFYTVSWFSPEPGEYKYRVEEAFFADFRDARIVYSGSENSWTVPAPGKRPGSYYYRVSSTRGGVESLWSYPKSVTIYPIFRGLRNRWDGEGFIRVDEYQQVGTHLVHTAPELTEPNIIRVLGFHHYDPNPNGWPDEEWDSFYRVDTGELLSTSVPGDPAWKWGYSRVMWPYSTQPISGQDLYIGGQAFIVSGPHSTVTAFGRSTTYWRLVNRHTFTYWDEGGSWTQRVPAGRAVLHYDTSTRYLLHSDVLRRYYYNGIESPYTVQYISNLTESNAYGASSLTTSIDNAPAISVQGQLEPAIPGSERGSMYLQPITTGAVE